MSNRIMGNRIILSLISLLLIASCAPLQREIDDKQENGNDTDLFIVANPINLSQIAEISKFRSCVGHDYSGLNSNGEKETLRSMKHYLEPLPSLVGTDKITIFAPFDGKISEMRDGAPGNQMYIAADSGWQFIFFNVTPAAGIEKGMSVKAGQQLGTASTEIHNFDIAVKKFGWHQIFDSPFLHMKKTVLDEYAQHGVTPENVILPKDSRDADPCPVDGERNGDATFSFRDHSLDYVVLRSDMPRTDVITDAENANIRKVKK